MARQVWKFPLLSTGPMWIEMPIGATIVLVDADPATGLLAFWAEGEPIDATEDRRFKIVGTGHPIPDQGMHRGSKVIGALVWHLYEIPEKPDAE